MNGFRPGILAVAVAAAAAAGCAISPVADQAVQSARDAVQMAAADPKVRQRAPAEYSLAERSLAVAEQMNRQGLDPDTVAHQAYLAEQRARIALQTAELREAEATVQTAGEERARVLAEARKREAEARSREVEARMREAEAAREQAIAEAREAQAAREQAEQRARELQLAREREQTELAARQDAAAKAAELNAELQRLQGELRDLKARQTERGWVLTMGSDLLFDPGKAELKPGAQRSVENLAQFLRRHPQQELMIEGFTDSTGSVELNRRLSEQRAGAVKDALVAQGIDPIRISTRGYGPAFPVASNETPTGRQLNRRVEIVLDPVDAAAGGPAPAPAAAAR
jgi:outer membrane protein OmpA-like peptidoglycan-associated protein